MNGGRILQLRNWQETGQGCRNCWRTRRRTRSAMQHCLENMGQKEKALKFYRLAFYSAELMKREGTAKVARRSYEKLLGKEIQWY